MSPVGVRRALHGAHSLTTLVLLVTGFLIELPDLRAWAIGGYGRELATIHNWIGLAFIAAPALALAAAGPLLRDLRQRMQLHRALSWTGIHAQVTALSTLLLSISGLLLWADLQLPLWALDASLEVHIALTWLLAASLPVHLFMARHRLGLLASRLLERLPRRQAT